LIPAGAGALFLFLDTLLNDIEESGSRIGS